MLSTLSDALVYLPGFFFTRPFSFTLHMLVSVLAHVFVCAYCICVQGLSWVCLPLAQVGVYLSWCFYCLCVRADRMCDACQHTPGDERTERVWK